MSDNLVKSLREKTEEADLDTILKTTLGGYTRKSVREYISLLRRQQYDVQQSFSQELQLSQTERERLAFELEEANGRACAAEEALNQARPLMEKVAGLEKDMDEAVARIQSDAALLEQQSAELQRLRSECDGLRAQLEEREAEPTSPTVDVLPAQPAPRRQPPPSGPKPCSCSLPSSPGSGKPPKSGWKASSDRKNACFRHWTSAVPSWRIAGIRTSVWKPKTRLSVFACLSKCGRTSLWIGKLPTCAP